MLLFLPKDCQLHALGFLSERDLVKLTFRVCKTLFSYREDKRIVAVGNACRAKFSLIHAFLPYYDAWQRGFVQNVLLAIHTPLHPSLRSFNAMNGMRSGRTWGLCAILAYHMACNVERVDFLFVCINSRALIQFKQTLESMLAERKLVVVYTKKSKCYWTTKNCDIRWATNRTLSAIGTHSRQDRVCLVDDARSISDLADKFKGTKYRALISTNRCEFHIDGVEWPPMNEWAKTLAACRPDLAKFTYN